MRALTLELERVRLASREQAEATGANTAALIENTAVQARRSDGVATTAGRTLARVFTSGFGLSPLLSGLVRLFQRQDEPKMAPLIKYMPPPPIHFEGYVSRTTYSRASEDFAGQATVGPSVRWREGPNVGVGGAPLNITVQVQAIDSRSFLDHSWEIARAVKEAMLESHSLNDVVMDL